MRLLRPMIVVAVVAACGGGGGDNTYGSGPGGQNPGGGPATSATVTAPGLTFSPQTVTLAKNGSVTWTFGSVAHGVVFDTPNAPAGIASCSNCSNTEPFPTTGTFEYHCTVHGVSMAGTITVQ